MTAVESLYVAPQAHRPALQRIRRWSLPFEIAFAGLALLDVVFLVVIVWLLFNGPQPFGGAHLRLGPEGGMIILGDTSVYPGSIDVSELPLATRLVGLLIAACVLGAQIAAFYGLHKLFGAYRRGIVFAEPSMRWMRRAGFFLLAAGAAPLAFQPLMRAAGLLDQRWFQSQSIMFLLVGGALFVLANIIALGREIEKEGEGYV